METADVQTEAASPFHAGEQQVQERLGVREEIEPWARRVVRPFLTEEHQEFFSALPYVVLAARDDEDRPWATLLAGLTSVMGSPDRSTLEVRTAPATGDALATALGAGTDVGFLGIDLATRRRNRVNGRVSVRGDGGFSVAVDQAFGNCPQHIHERAWQAQPAASAPEAHRHAAFTPLLRQWIERADTFFIATGHRGRGESSTFGMDASHRGGTPGFVQVEGDRELVFPDYAGNNHFNTLGNLILDPLAGLLFVDFERGNLLQLTGRMRIDWDPGEGDRHRFPGARRLVYFELDLAVELTGALPLRFDEPGEAVRSLRVVEKRAESDDVTSFRLEARDGGPLPAFVPGQHLPLEIEVPGHSAPLLRTYSLSSAPADAGYRISVKREPLGQVSSRLHDAVDVGAILTSRSPRGDFVLDDSSPRPVVLVSAGVGLTPLVSMLRSRVIAADSRPVWFVHGARDGAHHALASEMAELATSPGVRLHTVYSRPRPEDKPGRDYDEVGRIDAALLQRLLPDLSADFYLCGPVGFMAAIQEGLERQGVDAKRVYTESFGPS